MKSLWCLFGLHRWDAVALTSLINPMPLMRCTDCGIGEQWSTAGNIIIRFTKEEMETLLDQGRRWHEDTAPMKGEVISKHYQKRNGRSGWWIAIYSEDFPPNEDFEVKERGPSVGTMVEIVERRKS